MDHMLCVFTWITTSQLHRQGDKKGTTQPGLYLIPLTSEHPFLRLVLWYKWSRAASRLSGDLWSAPNSDIMHTTPQGRCPAICYVVNKINNRSFSWAHAWSENRAKKRILWYCFWMCNRSALPSNDPTARVYRGALCWRTDLLCAWRNSSEKAYCWIPGNSLSFNKSVATWKLYDVDCEHPSLL